MKAGWTLAWLHPRLATLVENESPLPGYTPSPGYITLQGSPRTTEVLAAHRGPHTPSPGRSDPRLATRPHLATHLRLTTPSPRYTPHPDTHPHLASRTPQPGRAPRPATFLLTTGHPWDPRYRDRGGGRGRAWKRGGVWKRVRERQKRANE